MELGFSLPFAGSWATPDNQVTVARRAEELGEVALPLPGTHNVLNALGVLAVEGLQILGWRRLPRAVLIGAAAVALFTIPATLKELSIALAAFQGDLKSRGVDHRVCTLVFSEFGRRVKENASNGTDHGAASCLFVAGPSVKGGVVGKHPSLSDLDDGDLKHHTDFRSVYATLLDHWLGCDSKTVLGGSFPVIEALKPRA